MSFAPTSFALKGLREGSRRLNVAATGGAGVPFASERGRVGRHAEGSGMPLALAASYLDAIAGRGAAALEMDDLVAQEGFGAARAEWVGVVRCRRESLCRRHETSYQRDAAQRLAPII
eukprot:gene9945-biopygen7051